MTPEIPESETNELIEFEKRLRGTAPRQADSNENWMYRAGWQAALAAQTAHRQTSIRRAVTYFMSGTGVGLAASLTLILVWNGFQAGKPAHQSGSLTVNHARPLSNPSITASKQSHLVQVEAERDVDKKNSSLQRLPEALPRWAWPSVGEVNSVLVLSPASLRQWRQSKASSADVPFPKGSRPTAVALPSGEPILRSGSPFFSLTDELL